MASHTAKDLLPHTSSCVGAHYDELALMVFSEIHQGFSRGAVLIIKLLNNAIDAMAFQIIRQLIRAWLTIPFASAGGDNDLLGPF